MSKEGLKQGPESIEKANLTIPAVESLLDPARARESWPDSLTQSGAYIEQVQERQSIIESINEITSSLPKPDTTMLEALESGNVTREQAIRIYESLTKLVGNKDYERAALYIPFEYLSNLNDIEDGELREAAEGFKSAYMEAWHSMLGIHDVRANFTDGDVLEAESRIGDLPRVVKAAHLLPKLMECGMIQVEDALRLIDESVDPLFKHDMRDALMVCADLSFVEKSTIEELNRSIPERENEAEQGGITARRAHWLAQEQRRKAVETQASNITTALIDDASEELVPVGTSSEEQEAFVIGLRKAVESHDASPNKAKTLYDNYRPIIMALWDNADMDVRDEIATTLYHLQDIGIIDKDQLAKLGLPDIDLSQPFSNNLANDAETLSDMDSVASVIENNPELSRYLYPVTLFFGSRLKGYGSTSSDLDTAVLIRPEVKLEDKNIIRDLLEAKLSPEIARGITEFWLEETPEGLGVRDAEDADVKMGERYWTHILFGAVWKGDAAAIRKMHERLLIPYFSDDSTLHGKDARQLYVEELERDTLQYRLMHRGYKRFHAPRGGLRTPHSDLVDGQSAFWDSGYRQTAIKLFAHRVFLPRI